MFGTLVSLSLDLGHNDTALAGHLGGFFSSYALNSHGFVAAVTDETLITG